MPHKHRRDKKGGDGQFELPPDSVARPLSTSKAAAVNTPQGKKRKRARKDDDDTPRAFARLMAWQKGARHRSGLDDGAPKSKKRKNKDTEQEAPVAGTTTLDDAAASQIPQIKPGERLADYSARVDAALPLGGLVNKGKGRDVPGVKKPQTKTERKMQRMQKEWREIDARYKSKLQDAQEEVDEDEDPHQEALNSVNRSRKKGKRRGSGSEDDPWAAVAKARKDQAQASSGLVGVHDVVQAPPQLKAPKERFKMRNGARVDVTDVPGAAGSLRRREELGQARKNVIEGYREMVKKRIAT